MFLSLILCSLLSIVQADEIQTTSSWIWYPEAVASDGVGQTRYLRTVVELKGAPQEAQVRVLADDGFGCQVNGQPAPKPVGVGPQGTVYDLAEILTAGENVIAFDVINVAGTGGLLITGKIIEADGTEIKIHSKPESFVTSKVEAPGWDAPGFDASDWLPAGIVGNAFSTPWYLHPAFDVEPFLEEADKKNYKDLIDKLVALPPGLDNEPYARAKIVQYNDNAALFINGEVRPALMYRGTVDPLTEHGRRQIALFRDAGVHVYCFWLPVDQMWHGPGKYDFQGLDNTIRGYLSVDPDAYLVFILRISAPNWWMDAHPEELVHYGIGDNDYNTTDDAGRARRASFASKLWMKDTLDAWNAVIGHLEAQPWGKRVIGYQPGGGIYTEWHYYGSWMEQFPDTGPAMTSYFREWLKRHYASDADLQAAWGNPQVTLDAAMVPGVAPRIEAGPLGFREPVQQRWARDYYQCQQEVTIEDIDAFCKTAKEITGGRVFCGTFYGYFQGVHPQNQGGHLELETLIKSPNVDYFAAPYDYSHRLMGDDGRLRSIVDVFRLAGKVHMVEADTRTHLHPVEEYGKLADGQESVAAIRREMATAMTHDCALWWCDFGDDGSGGWYDDPQLIGEVAKLYRLANERLQKPQENIAEVAVVCDLRSCYWLGDGEAMRAHLRLVDSVTSAMHQTGTPFDMLLASQLATADLSKYKLLVFLNVLQADETARVTIKKATAGRSVLWLWAPGISDGVTTNAQLVQDLTGFNVTQPTPVVRVCDVICNLKDTLTQNLPELTVWQLRPENSQPVVEAEDVNRWFNPRDEKTMEASYEAFDWTVDENGLRWHVATTDGWSDIHLNAEIPQCQGLGLTLSGEGIVQECTLQVVVKGAEGGEFAPPLIPVKDIEKSFILPFGDFTKVPWDRSEIQKITFPLTGLKLVLYGTNGGREGTLKVRNLNLLQGETTFENTLGYRMPGTASPVLTITDLNAKTLGIDPQSSFVVLAAKRQDGVTKVLSTIPYIPVEVLTALMDEAGVCRYIKSPDVKVQADAGLISLHTKVGGTHQLKMPAPVTLSDALTGEKIGYGQSFKVNLPQNSTTLLKAE